MNTTTIDKIKELQGTDTDERYQGGLWDIADEYSQRYSIEQETVYNLLQSFFYDHIINNQ